MGFSVTAANVVFFVALLSAGSVGMSAYWKTQDAIQDGRTAEAQRFYNQLHTNLTLSSLTCTPTNCKGNGANNTVQFTIYNGGSTTLDLKYMSYIVQGSWTQYATIPTVTGPAGSVGSTFLVMPGESATVTLYHVTFNSGGNVWVKATTGDGVSVSGSK